MANDNPNTSGLIPFKPGQSGNPLGRPRKLVTQLKDMGYKLSEINDTYMTLTSMTVDEIKDVYENENATVLERTLAKALYNGLQKGSLYNLETILTRALGKPVETQQVKQEINLKAFQVTIVKSDVHVPFTSHEGEVKLD